MPWEGGHQYGFVKTHPDIRPVALSSLRHSRSLLLLSMCSGLTLCLSFPTCTLRASEEMASGGPWGRETPEDSAPYPPCLRLHRKEAAELPGFHSDSAISHCGGF